MCVNTMTQETISNVLIIDCYHYNAAERSKLAENCLLIPANPKAIRYVAKLTIDVVQKKPIENYYMNIS